MSFLSRLTKGLATLGDFISGLTKGILTREGATQHEIQSDAQISGGIQAPTGGGVKHRKTPYWAPTKKPVKIKLRTRGTKQFPYAWQARLKAKAQTKARARMRTTGIVCVSTGLLARIIGIRSFRVSLTRPVNGIKLFLSSIYSNIIGIKEMPFIQSWNIAGIILVKVGIEAATTGIKVFNFLLTATVLGTKEILNLLRLVVNGDIQGILTQVFKVTGKRDITKILYALGLLDKKNKR